MGADKYLKKSASVETLVAALHEVIAKPHTAPRRDALPELSHDDDAAKLASKMIQVMSQPYRIQGRSVSVTISIGVSIYPTHGEEVTALIKSADQTLCEAKRAGKSNCRIAVI